MLASVSCNLDQDLLASTIPLFEASEIEAIEWSFDTLYNRRNIPDWFIGLLDAFAAEDRLIGHGVFYSIFSARFTKDQENWLEDLRRKSARFNFSHITEHFGFMTGTDFHSGAPIAIPYSRRSLQTGIDRLKRLAAACSKPVGLENLALAYSFDEVRSQGAFLSQLLEPVNGFLILDVHNAYCQCHNFGISFQQFLKAYDLNLVREIHISGGSWEPHAQAPDQKVRRDTHDDSVPQEVFHMLEYLLPLCPNVRFVVLEQMGTALKTEECRASFRVDFLQMKQIVKSARDRITRHKMKSFLPEVNELSDVPFEDSVFHQEQVALSAILETAPSLTVCKKMLEESVLADSHWQIESWEAHMLETARLIAQKWK